MYYDPYRYSAKYKNKRNVRLNSNFIIRKNKSPRKNITLIIVVLILSFLFLFLFIKKQPSAQPPQKIQAIQKESALKTITLKNMPKINILETLKIPKLNQNAQKISIPAKVAILVDTDNKYVLYDKNDDQRVPVASITKIMTATVALENYNLSQVVTVPRKAANVTGSRMNLYTGEKITVRNLLYGLMLNSGNDAAYVLASLDPDSKDGDIEPFVQKMNQKAKMLGLDNTYFYCPAGLNDNGYSTAHDLAFLTSYALKNPTFKELVSTAKTTATSADGKYAHPLNNTNRLILPDSSLYLPGAIGVKTGFTSGAGHSLVGAAEQNGHTLVSVVLNTNNTAPDESARLNRILLTWGFSSYIWP